jgi:hypothetical protein
MWYGICGDMTARALLAFVVFVRGRWIGLRL